MSKKSISFILALALSVSCIGTTAFADPYSDKTQYEQELQQQNNEYKSAQEKVDEIEAAIQAVNSQMEDISIDIEELNAQISDVEERIDESNKKVKETQEDIQEENELFNKRMRSMYMNGMNSYVEVLLNSNGFSDFLSRLSNVATIIKYDNEVIDNLSTLKATLEDEKNKIENEKVALEGLQEENNSKMALLEEKQEEHNKALAVAEENRDLFLAAKEQTEAQISEAMKQIEAMSGTSSSGSSRPSRGDSSSISIGNSGSSIVEYAKQFIGVPYQWGGNGPSTFDCSGLTSYVYRAHGISLPRTAQGQMNATSPVSRGNLQPGDLVFFGTPGNIYHVGIYVGNDCYLHAPQDNETVKISSMTYRGDFAGGGRP